ASAFAVAVALRFLFLGVATVPASPNAAGDLGREGAAGALAGLGQHPKGRPPDALEPARPERLPPEAVVVLQRFVHLVGDDGIARVGDVHDAAGQVDGGAEIVALPRQHWAHGQAHAYVGHGLVVAVHLGEGGRDHRSVSWIVG